MSFTFADPLAPLIAQSRRPYDVDIYVASNQKVTSKGIGNVRIKTETCFKVIKDVLYVRDLSANLLSVSALTKTGLKVNFHETICDIIVSRRSSLLKAYERYWPIQACL